MQMLNSDDYYVKLSPFRDNKYLLVWFLLTIIFGYFFLPETMKKPEGGFSIASIVFFLGSFCGIVFSILTDYRKNAVVKRIASISLIILSLLLFYWYSGAKWNIVADKFFNISALEGLLPAYWSGLLTSIKLTMLSVGFALILGMTLGILNSLHNPVFSTFIIIYVDLFRSIPLIALMILSFYALPFMGLNLAPFSAAALSIVLMYSAYISEIFRAGIESVAKVQIQAASTLGLSTFQTMRFILLPQALRVIIPPLTSSLIGILKDTSVAYVVTLPELLTKAQQAMILKRSPTPLIFVALIYFLILFPLTRYAGVLEKRSKNWAKKAIN